MLPTSIARGRRARTWLVLTLLVIGLVVPGAALAQPAQQDGPDGVTLLHDDPPRIAEDAPITPQSLIPDASGDYRIDSLLSGYQWPASMTTITYSFYDSETFNGAYYGTESGVTEVSEGIKANVRKIMAWYGSIMNRNFLEVTETTSTIGYIRFMLSNAPSYAYGYYPSYASMFSLPGDIHLNPAYDYAGSNTNGFQNPPGSHGYMSLAHEVGHTLGLKHPFDGSPTLPANEDNTSHTIMTYTFLGSSAGTPMPYDVLALHYIYGARAKWAGDDAYLIVRNADQYSLGGTLYLDPSWAAKQTIWDTGGFNTLDFSGANSVSGGYRLDMREVGWLTTAAAYQGNYFNYGIAIGQGVIFRDLVNSSSSDVIYANPYPNTFKGYRSTRVTGTDTIYNASSMDTVDLTGYASGQVGQAQSGNDLVLTLGSNGSITLRDYYLSPDRQPAIIFVAVPPSISISDAAVTEGNAGNTAAAFTVSLSYPAAETISVTYATADGAATAPDDYTATGGTVTFAAGITSQGITVQVLGDTTVEANETFAVNLGTVTGSATIADGQGIGTIVNDDQPPPADPSVLTATAVSSTQVNLAWTDNATNETGYYVERSTDGGAYARIATLAANTTSYANTGLTGGTLYAYRVQAYHASAVSGYSNVAPVTPPAAPVLHIGDLDGASVAAGRKWNATVTITVHNQDHSNVSGAVVTGRWGTKGSVTCTTAANGQCSLSKTGLATTTPTIVFTVLGVTQSGATYSAANHDPDGDSTGTAITISKPK